MLLHWMVCVRDAQQSHFHIKKHILPNAYLTISIYDFSPFGVKGTGIQHYVVRKLQVVYYYTIRRTISSWKYFSLDDLAMIFLDISSTIVGGLKQSY